MKEITIIGGGIAGLGLGIFLRAENVPVTVFEAGAYPRHKVCGEFISGRGQDLLERLGTNALSDTAVARTGKVFIGNTAFPTRTLLQPALCISRYSFDEALARRLGEMRGRLFTRARREIESQTEGAVIAAGRARQQQKAGWKWFGLKAHASGVPLEADLELHVTSDGYVGLCRLAGGITNVCGLFRRPAHAPQPALPWQSSLAGKVGTVLHDRLRAACFDEQSFCSVAGLSFSRFREGPACAIGDAFSMIPPATGNGISMALESAWMAKDPIVAYSKGECSWAEAKTAVFQLCKSAFERRLFWGSILHNILISGISRTPLALPILRSALVWELMFTRTRGFAFVFSNLLKTGRISPA